MQIGHGYGDYRRACGLLNVEAIAPVPAPHERALQIPAWLTTELISTPAAEAKLRAWAQRTPPPWPASTSTDVLTTTMTFIGDELLAGATARVLVERVPPPVRDYVLARVAFVGVGRRILGFCGARRLTSDTRPWLIALSAIEQFDDLIGHEVCHAWLLAEPEAMDVAGGAIWHSAMYAAPMSQVPASVVADVTQHRREYRRDEDLADTLARSWGFGSVS